MGACVACHGQRLADVAAEKHAVRSKSSEAEAPSSPREGEVRAGRAASFVGGSAVVEGELPAAWVQRVAPAVMPHLFSKDGQVKLSATETLARLLPRSPNVAAKQLFAFVSGPPTQRVITAAEEVAMKKQTYLALGVLLGLVQAPSAASDSDSGTNESLRCSTSRTRIGSDARARMNPNRRPSSYRPRPAWTRCPGEPWVPDEFCKEPLAAFVTRMDSAI